MKGFFCINRDIFNQHSLWKNPLDFRLYFFLYGHCNFKEVEHKGFIIKRGQWLRSQRQLQKDLEYKENNVIKQPSLSQINRSIKRLSLERLIDCKTTDLGTLFTVLQYEEGQGFEAPQFVELGTGLGTPNALARNKNNNDIKNNDIKTKKKKKEEVNIHDVFYLSYGKLPTPIQLEKLFSFAEDGLEEELISTAIEKASGVSNHFNYLMTILNDWNRKGMKNGDDLIQLERKKEEKKQQQKQPNKRETNNTASDPRYDFGF